MGFYDLWGLLKDEMPDNVIRGGPLKPRGPTPGLNLPLGAHVPDYKTYKVENAAELLDVQKKLAARGLRNPWLRNDVWRYERKFFGTKRWRIWHVFGLGFKYGVPLTVLSIIYEIYFKGPDPNRHHYKNLYYKDVHDSHH